MRKVIITLAVLAITIGVVIGVVVLRIYGNPLTRQPEKVTVVVTSTPIVPTETPQPGAALSPLNRGGVSSKFPTIEAGIKPAEGEQAQATDTNEEALIKGGVEVTNRGTNSATVITRHTGQTKVQVIGALESGARQKEVVGTGEIVLDGLMPETSYTLVIQHLNHDGSVVEASTLKFTTKAPRDWGTWAKAGIGTLLAVLLGGWYLWMGHQSPRRKQTKESEPSDTYPMGATD